jgi:hypothetical protein
MVDDERYTYTRQLARAANADLLRAYAADPNIIGAGFGRRNVDGQMTDAYAAVVYVIRKAPEQFVPLSRLLPRRVYFGRDYVEVDVVETGPFYPQAFTARERPAPSGISISHLNVTAGTLGCLVTDNTDGSLCILSNNHVMADQNAAAIGDPIVQPGTADGGTSPADDIAALKRFVTINAMGNQVDAAIAEVNDPADVVNQMKDNLMPVPSPDHPALGLHFAGSCNRALMNPIAAVLNQLNIQLLGGAAAAGRADVGMPVEKVGRTTEYTTADVTEIDVTVTIPYDFGNAQFTGQIARAYMTEGGDSGSIVCAGGEGGDDDNCGCLSISAAEKVLGVELGLDEALEKEFREKYLSQTRVGRYAIDLYFLNERKIVRRARSARVNESDRAFARYLYRTYADEARRGALQPNNPDIVLSEEHLKEARAALGRAEQYLSKEEFQAAERLYKLATQAEGKNASEILEMLNDRALLEEVMEIMREVPSLRQPERQSGHYEEGGKKDQQST